MEEILYLLYLNIIPYIFQYFAFVSIGCSMPNLDELESLQLKCNLVTEKSLKSTRRMISICQNSKLAGMKSLMELDDQGEKQDR